MKFLKKRETAIIITIAIVLVATLYGVNRSVTRLASDIEDMFYDGVFFQDAGFTQPGLNSHLENSTTAALNVATMLLNYPELADKAESVLVVRRALIDEHTIAGRGRLNQVFVNAFADLVNSAKDVNLAERDAEAVSRNLRLFMGAQANITDSRYHEKVAAFDSEISFIAQVFKIFLPVRSPEAFQPATVPQIQFP